MSELDRREFLGSVAAGAATASTLAAAEASRAEASGLEAPAFRPLPLGSIRPEGWLLRQLQLQRDGLTGHLDEFWPDVAESQWFGGAAEGWERAPYWLDGAIPLAFLLNDAPFKERLARRVDHVVAHQRPDGWYAPYPADADAAAKPYDPWAILLVNEALVQYHDATGDECLAGRNPLQGTDLCAVVEFMYSLETLYSVFGDPWFADRLERAAWNALPATFAPDMWSHQYDQQANQVQGTVNPEHLFTTNGPESNIFGLEPNFGCCTANMHQGWPKLAAHLWMKTEDEGLVAATYACAPTSASPSSPASMRRSKAPDATGSVTRAGFRLRPLSRPVKTDEIPGFLDAHRHYINAPREVEPSSRAVGGSGRRQGACRSGPRSPGGRP